MVPQHTHPSLHSLTGLRFLAALSVFVYHASTMALFGSNDPQQDRYAYFAENGGFAGVSFFFVLSGFVLAWAARPGERATSFWRRRLLKIFPNHVVTFVAALLVYAAATTTIGAGALNLLLLHAWVPNHDVFLSVNYPSWSLSCELFFYLLFPALFTLVRRIREDRLWWAAGGAVVAIFCLPAVSGLLPVGQSFPASGQPISITAFWFVYIFPPARLLEFGLGMLMARIVLSGRWIRLGALPATALVAIGYVAGLFVPYLYRVSAMTVIPIALLIAAVANLDVRGNRSVLRNRVMITLGEISFAFYLIHHIIMFGTRGQALTNGALGPDAFYSAPVGIGIILIWLAATLIASWLLYALVERPIMRRWARKRDHPVGALGST